MSKADKPILTTAGAAGLLGISVRTAQLLIEGGSIPSWKTPGGHRRVYRADVEALMGEQILSAPAKSALVVVLADPDRIVHYDLLFAGVPECSVRSFTDAHAALLAIGSIRPSAIVVDLKDMDPARLAALRGIVDDPALGPIRIMAVAADPGSLAALGRRVMQVDTPDMAVAMVRMLLADVGETAFVPTDASFPVARNERQRLTALERSGLLDTAPEKSFDALAWLAAQAINAPIALMPLLTPTRQWFKARIGLDLAETPRSWAFCNHTILQNGIFSVEDLAADPLFATNPAVAQPEGFRFYAGAPIHDREGFAIGTLCVIDHKPRTLDETQKRTLLELASLASNEFRLRATERQLAESHRSLPRAGGAPRRLDTDR